MDLLYLEFVNHKHFSCLHYNFNIHIYQLKTQDKLTNITQKNRAIMTRSFYLNIFVAL